MSEREALVRKILLGIDETENESEHGWWETSSGAEFGKKKLEELIAALTAPQQESARIGHVSHARSVGPALVSVLAAPQPDGVVVPRRLLADCRDDVAECMGREYKSHRVKAYQEQLAEIDSLLAAAKEPRK